MDSHCEHAADEQRDRGDAPSPTTGATKTRRKNLSAGGVRCERSSHSLLGKECVITRAQSVQRLPPVGRRPASPAGGRRRTTSDGSRPARSAFATSAAAIMPLQTMPLITRPKPKIGNKYSNIATPRHGVSEQNQTDANPKGEDAGNPETHENSVVAIHEEPESYTDD